jgi:hypothetical protein
MSANDAANSTSEKRPRQPANRVVFRWLFHTRPKEKDLFMQKQRRDFLKITAAGAAGLALARTHKAFAAWPSSGTLAVNPTISNMRVVGCVDTKMMKSTPAQTTFAAENAAVDSARVQANMDAMAMQLANQSTADAAWKAIFRSSKDWAATKVAIKINSLEPANTAHIAIVQKFCTILAGLGVPPANIIVYDGQSAYSGKTSVFATYFSLTDTTKIGAVLSNLNGSLGGTVSAAIPGGTGTCTAAIANGTIDILINIANNKGHDLMGRATLCMKNHFGTFAPKHDLNYLFNINKSDAILGGTPVRQQLCFVDSLFANKTQNVGNPEVMPCYLVMGVFAPAVDYLTIKKVREEAMGCTHDAATINSYLTTFGYTTADPVWVLVPPASGSSTSDGGTSADSSTGADGAGGGGRGGTSGAADAGGGTSAAAGRGGGGTSAAGGRGGGGTSGPAGTGGGGASGPAGTGSGGTSATGGSSNGGTGGSAGGGTSESAGTGGATASGGATSGGGTGGAGHTATSAVSASGGSAATGGTSAGAGSAVSAAGGSGGATEPTSGAVNAGKSGGGCNVAGGNRRATRWGAILAFGAVVAEKLRRLGSDRDPSA